VAGVQLTDEMRQAIDASVLCWLATVDADGAPSVSPKEVFAADGDRILIAHIASPRSVANITAEARVSVAVLDVFEQRGVRFAGRARVTKAHEPGFAEQVRPLERLTGGRFPIRAVIAVEVVAAAAIVAPSYRFFPDVPAEERRARALDAYGVRDR
jgi:predicted pyridoxine 5'-phosphate oxidase superfamily flavin-nucleotide-binding protein